MALQKNQVIKMEITDINNLGFGVAHVDGMAVFVSGAVDGEVVLGKIISSKKTYAIARCEEVLVPSKNRIEPMCQIRGCGGCAYQNISYDHELEIKRNLVYSAFKKVGLSEVDVLPVLTAKKDDACITEHYRNKAQYPVSQNGKGEFVIGFYGAKTHRVVNAIDCPLQSKSFAPIVKRMKEFFEENHFTAYDEETGRGLIRHIYLREAVVTGQIIVTLVINGDSIPKTAELISNLISEFPNIVGIQLNVNKENTNVICGEKYIPLYGLNYIEDELAGVNLKITAESFYQVNHDAADLLYRTAKKMANIKNEKILVDLYCGAGSIGLSFSDVIDQVIGVEIEKSSVSCAKENAKKSRISNAKFYCDDAMNTKRILESSFPNLNATDSIVVMDPPRKGSTETLLSYLNESDFKKILYISCNPETLARDVKYLSNRGYALSSIQPVDLFPRTGHVETVVLMSKMNTPKG